MSSVCTICVQQQKKGVSVFWCLECQEALCHSCYQQHGLLRASEHHNVISYDKYKKLPPFVQKIKITCPDHSEKYELYCKVHGCPICKFCSKSTHKDCRETQTLGNVISNIKTSVLSDNAYSDLEEVRQTLLNTIQDQEQNQQELDHVKAKICDRITQSTDQIINHINTLKYDLLAEIDGLFTEQKTEISRTTELLDSRRKNLEEIIKHKEAISTHASNLQAFLAIKEMVSTVKESEENLKDLGKSGKLDKVSLEFCMNEIENEILNFDSLGDLKITRSPYTLSFVTNTRNEAQTMSKLNSPVKLSICQQFELEQGRYCGCCSLPNGITAFADDQNHILNLFNGDGSLNSKIPFNMEDRVYDVTPINKDIIAVSHPGSNSISIVDAAHNKVIQTLSTNLEPRGIAHVEGDILFCVPTKGIMKVNIKNKRVCPILRDTSVYYNSHIAANKHRICYTSRDRDMVTVLDHKYNVLSEFIDKEVLKGPFGITIDSSSYIYAIGGDSQNLVVISPDGKKSYQLLSDVSGLNHPLAVHYDKNLDQIMIVDYNTMKTVVHKYNVVKLFNL